MNSTRNAAANPHPCRKDCLVVRLSALGDVLLTTGVVEYWYRRHGLYVHILTRSELAPVFTNLSSVRSVLPVTPEALRPGGWIPFCRAVQESHGHLPLVDLHANLRSTLLRAFWPNSTYVYPKASLARRLFRRTRHPLFSEFLRHSVPQRYAMALESAPPPPATVRPVMSLTGEERARGAGILATRGLRSPVALHPYATHPAKTPSPSFWTALVRALRQRGHEVVVIGRSPTPLFPDAPFDLSNQTDLRVTAAVLQSCRCLISGDSGPMHLATAVQTPVLALFGPTTKEWGFYPTGQFDTVYQSPCSKAPCSLHGQDVCTLNHACMASIQPEIVLDLLHELLSQIPPSPQQPPVDTDQPTETVDKIPLL